MLNGKELNNRGVITGHLLENITQHGCDIRLNRVYRLTGQGFVPAGNAKTLLPLYTPVECIVNLQGDRVWNLGVGYYVIDFMEGCEIPSSLMGRIIQRSSLARCGAWIYSSIFDAGFQTKQMGAFMNVYHPIVIEEHARVAQFYCYDCTEVQEEDLYNGQFQNQGVGTAGLKSNL